MSTETRLERVTQFLKDAIGGYSAISRKIEVNDDGDEYTDFSVVITYKFGDSVCTILRVDDTEEEIHILKGEDFYDTDQKDFLISLLLISLEHETE